ncbi:hypothetical protein Brsp01_42010 [Brucella sp. NBRC 12950]|nr:hypothetical protein Brsp01_42010 [Brucella sp. NBRC 12950]
MIAVGRAFEARFLSGFQTIFTHQSRRTVTSCSNTFFIQFNMHSSAAISFT